MSSDSIDQPFDVTFLMPCLNEELTVGLCVSQAMSSLQKSGLTGEVLIADNGSDDRSREIASSYGARVIDVEQRGYGSALIVGIENARSRYVIMGDADGSYAWDDVQEILQELMSGADLVMGNRFLGKIHPGAMPFINRYIGNPLLSFIGRLFYKLPVGDFHCGLRGFDREKILALDLRSPGMEFASEMVVKAGLSQLRISEVPTELRKDGRDRKPHLRPFHDGWRHLRFLFLYSPRWLFRIPGVFFSAIGLIGLVAMLLGLDEFGDVEFGPQTLIYLATAIVAGNQSVSFSYISEQILVGRGIMKPSFLLRKLTSSQMLERLLIVGLSSTTVGIVGVAISFNQWQDRDFGQLVAEDVLQISVPSVTLILFGIQMFLSAFLFEVSKGRTR